MGQITVSSIKPSIMLITRRNANAFQQAETKLSTPKSSTSYFIFHGKTDLSSISYTAETHVAQKWQRWLWQKHLAAAAAAKSLQSCPTLCDPIDGSPPGSTIPGILQARTLEWVAISFSNAWKWKVKGKSLSRALLSATPCTAAYQAPPFMGFSRQEYWSGVPLPSPVFSLRFIISLSLKRETYDTFL